jgi:hypothetical protein
MNATFRALCVLTLLAGPAAAADKPNFSGDWKMNAAKSNFGPVPGPASFVRKVTHAEPSLVIVEDQQGDMGPQNTARKFTTDGKEMSFEANGAEVKGSAVWDGNVLVVTSRVDAIGVQFTDRMTVSDDGRTLTSAVHIASPQGDIDITVVFDRQ